MSEEIQLLSEIVEFFNFYLLNGLILRWIFVEEIGSCHICIEGILEIDQLDLTIVDSAHSLDFGKDEDFKEYFFGYEHKLVLDSRPSFGYIYLFPFKKKAYKHFQHNFYLNWYELVASAFYFQNFQLLNY